MSYLWTDGSDYLMHHGIKGQRWGIRRYQNFDGSYTKAGLERYRKSEENYNKKKESYKTIRSDSSSSSYEKRMAKAKMKEAKRQMNKDYKHLAQDKKADKGKVLYREGKRITSNNRIIGASAAASIMSLIAEIPNNQLRAYYSHTSNY